MHAITVESLGELSRLWDIAAAAGHRVPILLRASVDGETGSIIAAADLDKFGMLPADLERTADLSAADPHLELIGLHPSMHRTCWMRRSSSTWVTPWRAASLAGSVGVPLRLVDVGGGLGIPYADGQAPLDLDVLGKGLQSLPDAWQGGPGAGRCCA